MNFPRRLGRCPNCSAPPHLPDPPAINGVPTGLLLPAAAPPAVPPVLAPPALPPLAPPVCAKETADDVRRASAVANTVNFVLVIASSLFHSTAAGHACSRAERFRGCIIEI